MQHRRIQPLSIILQCELSEHLYLLFSIFSICLSVIPTIVLLHIHIFLFLLRKVMYSLHQL